MALEYCVGQTIFVVEKNDDRCTCIISIRDGRGPSSFVGAHPGTPSKGTLPGCEGDLQDK